MASYWLSSNAHPWQRMALDRYNRNRKPQTSMHIHGNAFQTGYRRHNKPVNACLWSCSTRFTALEVWSRAVNRVLHSQHALTIT